MSSSEHHQVTDEEARRLAKGLVRLFRSPLKILNPGGFDEPVTVADAIRLGGILLVALNSATGDPLLKEKNKVFATKIAELAFLPEEMEEFLYNRIKERVETADSINEAITQVEELMVGPGAARRFIQKAITETLPKARRGRPTEFNPLTDPDRFLVLSEKLNPVCDLFLQLQEQFPRKSSKEIVDFLKPEEPNAVDLMRKHERFISETMNDFDFRILKTQKTRARRLADAVAGKVLFGWSFKYSVLRGGEFRRLIGVDQEE
jgi:hypothetical protein